MSTRNSAALGSGAPPAGTADHSDSADVAYRRAWWLLALYPVSFVAAFVIGEGILSAITANNSDPAFWQVLVAGTPALIVFVIPGILSVRQGRKAMGLGRQDGRVPAIVGAALAIGFVGLNVASYLVGLVIG
jgi:hypothetical protein